MRLFAAVFPPEPVLDHLALALDAVGAGLTLPDAPDGRRGSPRWVPRDAQHLTLAFYADVPEGAVPELAESLHDVARATSPFELRLRGAGSFAGRVLWVGVHGATDTLRELAEGALAASVREVPGDVRPHRAHLTVARARWGRSKVSRSRDAYRSQLDPAARALAVYSGPAWTVDGFSLVESRPGEGPQGGPLYRELERWAFAPS
ncbi:RNA 2',3'-cyclic phosphodiesterase [Luteimicrobium sp. NPDC057192]|uniref:RNA 2',3'-cyclic phosphodiesterase n=1 Tax=Luteimicrobium sp. NPDC057192 TaxID=3346042 RepID=UPI00363DDB08